jgi:hypothetical protein
MRCVADDGSGPRHLSTDAIEHAPLDTGNGRACPFERRRMNYCALREIRIELHDLHPSKRRDARTPSDLTVRASSPCCNDVHDRNGSSAQPTRQ